jgi:hypothetical protein
LFQEGKEETIELLEAASAAVLAALGDETTSQNENALPTIAPVIEIRNMVLEEDAIGALVDLIEVCGGTKRTTGENQLQRQQNSSPSAPVTIHFTNCSAVWFSWSALARALGNCQHVGFYGQCTFLKKSFLEAFLASASSGELKSLRIKHRINNEQVEALADGLLCNTILHTLDLRGSQIGDNADFSILGRALKDGCSKVKKLKLLGIELTNVHLEAMLGNPQLAAALVSSSNSGEHKSSDDEEDDDGDCPPCPMPALESLSLSFTSRPRNHSESLGKFLAHKDCHLRKLLIRYQGRRSGVPICITGIAKALETNTTLATLSLPGIRLNNADAILLAQALSKNSSLRFLDIRFNHIYDTGMIRLAETARRKGSLLKGLGVVGNPFGLKGSLALLMAAVDNPNLFYIDVNASFADRGKFFHQKIRYHTALNRGARRLQQKTVPLGLWPLAMERSQLMSNDETRAEKYPHFCETDEDLYGDVLFFLLRRYSSAIFPP